MTQDPPREAVSPDQDFASSTSQSDLPERRTLAGMLGFWVLRWEALLVALLIGVMIYNSLLSPYFLDTNNLLDNTSTFMEIGIIALPMTLIIISGNIDLSVASNAALCSVVLAKLNYSAGINIWLACLIALGVGTAAGLFNGIVTTKVRIPSLIVTLGTYALFRGMANGLLGSSEISALPLNFTGIEYWYVPGTHIPIPLVIFAGLAVVVGFILYGTVLGRYVFAIGNNAEATRFSGVAVDRIVILLFALSGLFAALAGIILTSRLGTSTQGLASNYELDAITAAVLAGPASSAAPGASLGRCWRFSSLAFSRWDSISPTSRLTFRPSLLEPYSFFRFSFPGSRAAFASRSPGGEEVPQ